MRSCEFNLRIYNLHDNKKNRVAHETHIMNNHLGYVRVTMRSLSVNEHLAIVSTCIDKFNPNLGVCDSFLHSDMKFIWLEQFVVHWCIWFAFRILWWLHALVVSWIILIYWKVVTGEKFGVDTRVQPGKRTLNFEAKKSSIMYILSESFHIKVYLQMWKEYGVGRR